MYEVRISIDEYGRGRGVGAGGKAPFVVDSEVSTSGSLYPALQSHKKGHLHVSNLHSIYYEVFGNPSGRPVVCEFLSCCLLAVFLIEMASFWCALSFCYCPFSRTISILISSHA